MMTTNEQRIGNFTSSEIAALMTTGKQVEGFGIASMTYIEEKNMEFLLGRSIKDEVNSKPISWGNLLEPRVFELLGLEYNYSSKETHFHPIIPYWAGSPDGVKHVKDKTVFDIKCPMTLKSFIKLVLPLYVAVENGLSGNEVIKMVRDGFTYKGVNFGANKAAEDYYYQLVSNACILDCSHAELIIYMPFQSELAAIKQLADGNPTCYWMNFIGENEIPFLNDGGFFNNLNVIRFEVPKFDKDLLTSNVLKAGKYLIKNRIKSTLITTGNQVNGQPLVIVESSKPALL